MSLCMPTIMRLVALRRAGLSCAAAAAVVNLDERREGDTLVSAEQARSYTRRFGVEARPNGRGGFYTS